MMSAEQLSIADRKVGAFLERRFPMPSPGLAYYSRLWAKYRQLNLANPDFVAAFTSGEDAALRQRTWEMLLARHLDSQGHHVTCDREGPDFRIEIDGRVVWIEAVAPRPMGIPQEWLIGDPTYTDVPHEQILLRWTAAFKEKREKFRHYRSIGFVRDRDVCVIAVNGCQLSRIPYEHGPSPVPVAVETVFPAGPLGFQINNATGRLIGSVVTCRPIVINKNGSHVSTSPFMNPEYSAISAIIGCSTDYCESSDLPLHLVHNPLADNKMPRRALGHIASECVAEFVGPERQELDLHQLDHN